MMLQLDKDHVRLSVTVTSNKIYALTKMLKVIAKSIGFVCAVYQVIIHWEQTMELI